VNYLNAARSLPAGCRRSKMEDFYCEQVLSGKTQVEKIAETENVLAFYHTRPFWETHVVVIPKKHVSSLLTIEESDAELFLEIFEVIKKVAEQVVKQKGAARVLTNLGEYQDSKHLHFHVYSGERIRQ
jgi:histidine triad (HIT) family protein